VTPRSRLRAAAVAAVSALAFGVAGPVSAVPASPSSAPAVLDVGPTSFSGPGPYGVGERTLTLPSGSRVEVWYPARRVDVQGRWIARYNLVRWLPSFYEVPDGFKVTYPSGGVRRVPVKQGEFPLVVFSHGYAGFRTQSSSLTSAIASWGFVVAAPEHPSRDITKILGGPAGTTTDVEDLQATITLMKALNRSKASHFFGHVDADHIAALGHSAGGRASEQLALVDKRVDTFVGLAGASVGALDSEGAEVPDKPGLLVAATDDGIVPLDKMQAAYAAMNAPKRFVEIGGSGHLVFSDICEIGAGEGGLTALAAAIGIDLAHLGSLSKLATDGCIDPAVAPTDAWPSIQQVVVAYLRRTFGLDPSDAALTGLEDAYPGIVVGDESVGDPLP